MLNKLRKICSPHIKSSAIAFEFSVLIFAKVFVFLYIYSYNQPDIYRCIRDRFGLYEESPLPFLGQCNNSQECSRKFTHVGSLVLGEIEK